MEKKKSLITIMLKQVVKFAESNATKSANTTCDWWDYQSKLPDSVKKLRKF